MKAMVEQVKGSLNKVIFGATFASGIAQSDG